jgi:hypothetical protein
LFLLTSKQRRASHGDDRQITVTGSRLNWARSETAVDALELLPDSEDSCVQIDVCPPESEHLSPPHAVDEQEHERGMQRIVGSSPQKGQGLFGGPGTHLGRFPGATLRTWRIICTFRSDRPAAN